jgi:uncharacterized protein YwbE
MTDITPIIDITRQSAPPYPLYCAMFLQVAKPLDKVTKEIAERALALSNAHPAEIGVRLNQIAIDHLAHLVTAAQFPFQNLGWTFAAKALPLAPVQNFCADKKGNVIVAQANHRVQFLAPYFGQAQVAQLLPPPLRTERAAAHMHQEQHYALAATIHAALVAA